MARWFAPKVQPPAAPPPAEAPPSRVDPSVIQSEERERIRRRRGRAATLLTSSQGDPTAPNVGVKTLLGS